MSDCLPTWFISHGAPVLALDADDPTHRFLRELGAAIGKPKAVLVISAHWEAATPQVSAAVQPETIHDFFGFPQPLYRLAYRCPGAPLLAARVAGLLGDGGIKADIDPKRGLDHGAWIPLMLMYPDADVPVTQLSVQTASGSEHHAALGRALRPLRDEGVLILGSGGFIHNLSEVDLRSKSDELPEWAAQFRGWICDAIEQGRHEDLLNYRSRAPHAVRNHPSEEHFLPLFVAAAAADSGKRVHADVAYRSLVMDAFRFD
ncbi:MAG: class III extradiol ring-cleavage dioxygenase [Burkholderiales bacterium]|jgi:4,5-DOPA dioxygenase extradiol